MKKPSIIIGKKQIRMSCLTLMLAVAVYINYATAPNVSLDDKTVSAKRFSYRKRSWYGNVVWW